MHPYLSSCRMVRLNNPYEQWRDPLVRELFEKTTTLKFEGYGRKYPSGVIPTDASSWFCDHLLICRERDDGLLPIMGFQCVSLDRCRQHYRSFPPLAMCEEAGDARHIVEMKKLVTQFDSSPHKLTYTSCFTIAPELRADRSLVDELLRLLVVLKYFFHREEGEGHEIVTGGTARFKIDTFWMNYGFIPLVEAEEENDKTTLTASFAAGEETRLLRLREFNRNAEQLAQPYTPMWENRIVIGKTGEPSH